MTTGSKSERELLLADDIVYGADGYAPRPKLDKAYLAGDFSVSWWQGGTIVSGKLRASVGGGLWKNRNRFMPPLDDSLLTQLGNMGIRQPASYGSCYHALQPSPRVKRTVNNIFAWWPGGPWQEARLTGRHFGKHYRYDLCSAYRWAATLGLPDTRTFKVWENYTDPRAVNGLWVCDIDQRDTLRLPSIFGCGNPVVLSSEDMRLYDVTPTAVYRGVTWGRMLPSNYVEETLQLLPCAKQAGRAYWGRWISRDQLECRSDSRTWKLPNIAANFVWGLLIISRVRGRVWEVSQRAVHVYVDEVIIPHEIETGSAIGDWQLKETFNGVDVHRTGWYGTATGATVMQTGVSRVH